MARYRRIQLGSLCALALIATPLLANSQAGNLMKLTVSSSMQIPGMAKLPPHTFTKEVCTSVSKPDPRQLLKQSKQCVISNYHQTGSTITYHMNCSGRMAMSGDGSFQQLPGGHVTGEMRMTSQVGQQTMTMQTRYHGERLKSCVYTPPANGI